MGKIECKKKKIFLVNVNSMPALILKHSVQKNMVKLILFDQNGKSSDQNRKMFDENRNFWPKSELLTKIGKHLTKIGKCLTNEKNDASLISKISRFFAFFRWSDIFQFWSNIFRFCSEVFLFWSDTFLSTEKYRVSNIKWI